MDQLNEKIALAGDIRDKNVLKFLQINVFVEFLGELISVEQKPINQGQQVKPKLLRRLATMKVLRNKLLEQRKNGVKLHGFKSENEILTYSWQLFQDKIN